MNELLTLAQELLPANRDRLLMWGGVIMAVAVVGCVAIMFLRRRMLAQQDSANVPGFSLAELRAMRDRGEITPEEYEQTRAHVIEKVKAKMNEPPKPKKTKGNDDR